MDMRPKYRDKPWIRALLRCRTTAMAGWTLLAIMTAPNALAAWKTSNWEVSEPLPTECRERGDPNAKHPTLEGMVSYHQRVMQDASRWYERLGFPDPLVTRKNNKIQAQLIPDSNYEGSYYFFNEKRICLSKAPSILAPDRPLMHLARYAAVHELFHGITAAYPFQWQDKSTQLPNCLPSTGVNNRGWLNEGAPAYLQIRWHEMANGEPYGHPFHGSRRYAWVRHFDQPLDWAHRPPPDPALDNDPNRRLKWSCDYGTWYFWYAVGEMLADKRQPDQRVAYLQNIFSQNGPWEGSGVAVVDAGLREAAEAFRSLPAYHQGLYSLYPEFVAQYLTEDAFFEHVQELELGTPAAVETRSTKDENSPTGPLLPLASRAWRVRVTLPDPRPRRTAIRVTLDAEDGGNRDQLHLIVDNRLIRRPVKRTTPYTWEEWMPKPGAADGPDSEFLIRIANVAHDAAATAPVAYRLKVEVEGFHGGETPEVTTTFDPERDAVAVAAELPPGFRIHGPDASWTCLGGSKARARFTVQTPDKLADSVEAAAAEVLDGSAGQFDDIMKMVQQMQRHGVDIGQDLDAMQEQLKEAQAKARGITEQFRPEIERGLAAAAAAAREEQTSNLQATFASDGGDCQMTIHAQWPGREGGQAMIITEPLSGDDRADFGISVQHKKQFQDFLDLAELSGQDLSAFQARAEAMKQPFVWQRRSCRELLDSCPAAQCTAGHLRLEEVTPTRLVGTFDFDVEQILRDPPQDYLSASCEERARRTPVARVSGHFSATSSVEDHRTMFDAYLPGRSGATLPGGLMLEMDNMDAD